MSVLCECATVCIVCLYVFVCVHVPQVCVNLVCDRQTVTPGVHVGGVRVGIPPEFIMN